MRQQATYREALDRVVSTVIADGKYVSVEDPTPFEARLAAFCRHPHAVGVSSGTSALHIALLAAGVESGDEVITVPNSFFATVEAIFMTGARPHFVDVDACTHLMSLPALAEAINERTRAIVPVHLFGNVVDVPAIQRMLTQRGREDIIIVEDCAHAIGATRAGQPVPLGRIGAFSFNPGKNIGGLGDGGAIVTDDEHVAGKAKLLRDHGRRGKNEHLVLGFNARLDRLNDSVLALKMDYLEAWNSRRHAHAARYEAAFNELEGISPVRIEPEVCSARYQFVIRSKNRCELRRLLQERGVATAIHYPHLIVEQEPMVRLGFKVAAFPVAARLNAKILSLPCFPELEEDEVSHVINAVRDANELGGPL
ncbi:MAG TPA: DegT/DnrJ/EryC1/StrS family aminotransferase [Pyrinomonadaceae bacterium]|nr:DegT/DnrJ/EryC1/StrS family aminotransferase [Pyrinomonadaceae bacterium]